eukprot:403368980
MKLHYFDVYGRADPIRMLLTHAKVEFEDHRFPMEEWPALKQSLNLEFGQVPMLEFEGKQYSQTNSILRFLGSKYGYYPSNAEEAYKADSLVDGLADLIRNLGGAKNEKDADKQKELFGACFASHIPKFFGVVEKRLTENTSKHHLVGEHLSIADFALAGLLFSAFYNDASEYTALMRPLVDAFPLLKAYTENLRDHELKDFLQTRPVRPF